LEQSSIIKELKGKQVAALASAGRGRLMMVIVPMLVEAINNNLLRKKYTPAAN
jgi:hypothetical protein